MAGDWIKMRADLHTHPKVVRIASALQADRLRIVGGLHSAWCLFDAHSVDGKLEGYSCATLDELIGFPGFSAAMVAVGWLEESEGNLAMPRFDEHNGKSAKRRAQDATRKKEVRKMSASQADEKRTREEKRREEEKKDIESGAPPVDNFSGDGNDSAGVVDVTLGKFPMHAQWQPSEDFTRRAALWGRMIGPDPGYTPAELQQFRDYWTPEQKIKYHNQWEQAFAASLVTQRQQQRARKPARRDITQISKPDDTIPAGFRG